MLRGLGKFDYYHFVLSLIVLSDTFDYYGHLYDCAVLHIIRVRYGFMILKHINRMYGNNNITSDGFVRGSMIAICRNATAAVTLGPRSLHDRLIILLQVGRGSWFPT